MFKAITSFTTNTGSTEAVDILVGQCRDKLGIYRPTTGILYCSLNHSEDQISEVILGLNAAFPGIDLVGCTVIAGFTDESGYKKEGYFLTLISTDEITIEPCLLNNLSELQQQNRLAEQFRQTFEATDIDALPPKLCLIFPSYPNIDGDRLVYDLHSALPDDCLIVGGSATDYWNQEHVDNFSIQVPPLENTKQYILRKNTLTMEPDSMVCLLFSGPVELQTSYAYGWSDTGKQFQAKAEGSRFTEIDGMDPIDFLTKYNHPLATYSGSATEYAFWIHERGKDPYLRDIFIDETGKQIHTNHQSLPGNIKISFSFPDEKHVLKEYVSSIAEFKDHFELILNFTCCIHLPLLKDLVQQEYSCHKITFPRTPLMCSYVFGEFGPSRDSQKSILHSCSSITLGIRGTKTTERKEQENQGNVFFYETIRSQKATIESLNKQLNFFENNKNNKKKKFTEDCLGLILANSPRSITGHADQLSRLFKNHYNTLDKKPPYPISRNRIIDHLKAVSEKAKKKFILPD